MAKIKLNIRQDEQIDLDVHQFNHYADIVEIQSWAELLESYLFLKQDVHPKKVFLVLDDQRKPNILLCMLNWVINFILTIAYIFKESKILAVERVI